MQSPGMGRQTELQVRIVRQRLALPMAIGRYRLAAATGNRLVDWKQPLGKGRHRLTAVTWKRQI